MPTPTVPLCDRAGKVLCTVPARTRWRAELRDATTRVSYYETDAYLSPWRPLELAIPLMHGPQTEIRLTCTVTP